MIYLVVALSCAADPIQVGIARTFPEQEVVLPTNAQLVVFVSGTEGAFDLVTPEGDVIDAELVGNARVVTPALEAGVPFSASARCDGCGERILTWPVGDVDDVDAPVFDDGGVTGLFVQGFHSGGLVSFPAGYEIDLDLPRLDELAIIRLDGDDGSFFPDACCGAAERTHVHFILDGGEERTECFDAIAVDIAGNETPFAEPLCFELTHDLLEEPATCNCSSNGVHGTTAALVLLALFTRRTIARRAP